MRFAQINIKKFVRFERSRHVNQVVKIINFTCSIVTWIILSGISNNHHEESECSINWKFSYLCLPINSNIVYLTVINSQVPLHNVIN